MADNIKVNYVISNYLGDRRYAPKLKQDPLFYAKAHCKFFQENKIDSIAKVTFVLNKSEDKERDNEFIDFIKKSKLNVEHEIIVRDNIGFSYGAWQDVVEKNKDFDYHFLIEDDYIPSTDKIIDFFIKGIKPKTIFVCCIYERGHCAISIGLLNTKVLNKESGINPDMILNAKKILSAEYRYGIDNQINFLKNFEELGYTISDMSKDYRWLFVNHNGNITQYGNIEGKVIIKPLDVNSGHHLLNL